MIRNAPRGAAVFGVDLGKTVFHVVGLDERGAIIQRAKFRRDSLLTFFARATPTVVGMEACPGSQGLARKLQAMGHQVRIVPAQFVKPCVKSQKNDTIDAAAIAEAVTRPTMRFTQVRSTEQVDLQALHRIRDQLITARTRVINQARAFCLEQGVAIRQGTGVFRLDLPRVIADDANDLTPAMRRMLAALFEDVAHLDQRIAGVTREIEAIAARDERARRLTTIPGIGPLAATALGRCRRRTPVPPCPRPCGLARPDPARALHGWQDDAARDQQAREPLRAPAPCPRRALLRQSPRRQAQQHRVTGQPAPDTLVRILDRGLLPGCLRIAKPGLSPQAALQLAPRDELQPAIEGQALPGPLGQRRQHVDQAVHQRTRTAIVVAPQHRVAAHPFNHAGDIR